MFYSPYFQNETKLNKITNKLGNIYYKKNFGLPKFKLKCKKEKYSIDTNIYIKDMEKNIHNSNLFFIWNINRFELFFQVIYHVFNYSTCIKFTFLLNIVGNYILTSIF